MEDLDLKQMSAMVDIIAEEKGLPREAVLNVIEQAIAAAWRRDNGDRAMNVRASLNTTTGEADVYVAREVIEDGLAYTPATEIPLAEALKDHKDAKLGDIVEEKFKVTHFERVGAQTAKQVMISRLREAENDAVLSAFEDKIGTIVTGTIARVEPKLVRIDLGRASGIMPKSEQIEGEYYTVGNRTKVYIKNIEHSDRGAQLILSRGSAEFIEYLFRQEVPELDSGTVE
ncbi:MAG: NusA N-terminal domain-containing protein, partial [Candidatus Saccharimonadaceae bacterium]|nr:NusA N-terminal domain-containing protein [Candidatus Saccharimonadaceae bacterium]